MIHIATIHWKSDRWIRLQQAFFARFTKQNYRFYGWLNDVPNPPRELFHYSCTEEIASHPIKLNLLADIIAASARDDDIIIFCDGDAFPIAPLDRLIDERLEHHQLIAVQRRENNGDAQPHPCFCVTTVGLWKAIRGDWKPGHTWIDVNGNAITDVGGNLLRLLGEHGVQWYPLLRTNQVNLHPLFFGVYGDVVYHHTAGFRPGIARIDLVRNQPRSWRRAIGKIPYIGGRFGGRRLKAIAAVNDALSDRVFLRIQSDPDFYLDFVARLRPMPNLTRAGYNDMLP